MNMNIQARATSVARVFDTLAWVVIAVGVVSAGVSFLGLTFGTEAGFFAGLIYGLLAVALVGIYTALTWASITLGTIVAGYIAQRSRDGASL